MLAELKGIMLAVFIVYSLLHLKSSLTGFIFWSLNMTNLILISTVMTNKKKLELNLELR